MFLRQSLLVLALVANVNLAVLSGQERAVVAGAVQTDTGGHPIAHAAIALTCLDGQCADSSGRYVELADSLGQFRFAGLTPGLYDRQVTFIGFRRLKDTVDIQTGSRSWPTILLRHLGLFLHELPARVHSGPRHREPDGSTSEVKVSPVMPVDSLLRQVHVVGDTIVGVAVNTARGCGGVHSIEHSVNVDSLTVILVGDSPALCPSVYHPVLERFTVHGLRPGTYLVRAFLEGRAGRGGPASGGTPFLTGSVRVP
jgi:hypothetical protein